ncbi:MAG TPA: hypothetical protein VNT79_12715 [Phycisphaerae bacterium]|nr:hypothetical protein [Phycisphaerae bacterium]
MRGKTMWLCGACLVVTSALVIASKAQDPVTKPGDVAHASRPAKQAELEDRFKRALTNVIFRGTWQMTNAQGLEGKAPLSPPRPERYVIKSVSKGLNDNWVITARVQFADRDVELPFNVRVVWAGDTPIITLDKTALPMLGTYSARVMVYDGFYAGAWFGTNYGGILSGQIIKAADEKLIAAQEKDADEIKLPPKPTTQPSKTSSSEPAKTEPRP